MLLAALASRCTSLFHTLTAQDIGHAIVAFVAGVFIHLAIDLRHRHASHDFIFERAGVVDCEFVIDRKLVNASKSLG